MDLVLAAIGTRMPDWVAAGWQEYARRLPPHLKLSLVELPVAGKAAAGRAAGTEAERLLARLPPQATAVALHGAGSPWPTKRLARYLADWQLEGAPVWFLVGGADGLGDAVLARCRLQWSLGPAVFPHMLVRILVAEQLYRAWTILEGHPYHRA